MTPAAVLSILVKTTGSQAAMAQMARLDATSKAAAKSTDGLAAAQRRGQSAFQTASRLAQKAAADVTKLEFAQRKAALAVEKAKLVESEAIKKSGAESVRARQAALNLQAAETRLAETSTQLAGAQRRSAEATAAMASSQAGASSRMAGVNEKLHSVHRAAGYVALGVGLIGAASVKTAATYEQSMNKLQSVAQLNGKQMKEVSRLAVKLGADIQLPGTSAQDAADAMIEMIKAGVSLDDTMTGVRSTLVLSAAANVDNARAAEIASNALNTFKLRGRDLTYVTDLLANTANASSVEIEDLAQGIEAAGSVFSAFQGPVVGSRAAIRDLNVALGILGNAGIKGAEAGTTLKSAFVQLTGPSDKAKSAMRGLYLSALDNSVSQKQLGQVIRGTGKERQAALKAIEGNNNALKKGGDIAYDASGKMRSLSEILRLVTLGTKGMTQEQKNAYLTQIFGSYGIKAIIALTQSGAKGWAKMTGASTRAGAAQDLANAKMKGFKGSVEALKSTLETLGITLGTPLLGPLAKVLRGFASFLSSIDPAALGIAIGMIGGIAGGLWLVVKAQAAWNALAAANPVGLIIVGLVALGAALVIAYKKSETFRNIVNGAWDAIKTGALAAVAVIVPAAKAVGSWLAGAAGTVAGAWQTAVTALTTAFNAVKGALVAAKNFVAGIVNAVITEIGKWRVLGFIVKAALTLMLAPFVITFLMVKNIVTQGIRVLSPIVSGGLSVVAAVAKTWLGVLINAFRIWGAVAGALFRTIFGVIKAVFSGAFIAMKGIVSGGLRIIHGVIQVIGGIFKGDFHQIWEGIKNIFKGALTAVVGLMKGQIKTITGAASAIGKGIKDGLTGALSGAVGLVRGFINDIIGIVNSVLGFFHLGKIPTIGGGNSSKTPSRANPAGDRAGGHTGLARGGAFARTGGYVNTPITLMGEEAPTYPEFVIPTNPAYRKRAQGLVAQAAGTVGFAEGGIFGRLKDALGTAIGQTTPGKILNGLIGLSRAGAEQFMNRLPGTGQLPEWMQGIGTSINDRAKNWIKGVFKEADSGDAGRLVKMVKFMDGVNAKGYPYKYGGGHGGFGGPYDCSGLVSAVLHAGGFIGSPMTTDGLKTYGTSGSGQMITIGVRGSTGRNAHTMMQIGDKFLESGSGHGAQWVSGWSGGFPIKRHPDGFAEGGVYGKRKSMMDPRSKDFVGWGLKAGGKFGKGVTARAAGARAASSSTTPISTKLSKRARIFAANLAALTGLNPNVIAAWIFSEEGGKGHPQHGDDNNWLNVGWTDSGPTAATRLKGWSNPATAAKMTANWMRGGGQISKVWGKASSGIQHILDAAGQGPDAQIKAITDSGWASSAYNGGLGGVYRSMRNSPKAKTSVTASGGKKGPKKITKTGNKPKRMTMSAKNQKLMKDTAEWAKIWAPIDSWNTHLQNQFALNELTPGVKDDLFTAAQGIRYADFMINKAATFAQQGVPGAFEWLANAKTARSDWVQKYGDVRDANKGSEALLPQIWRGPAEAAYAAAKADSTGGSEDNAWKDAIKQLAADVRTQTLRGQAIERMQPADLVLAWMQELSNGRTGTSAALAAQGPSSPGVVAGGYR